MKQFAPRGFLQCFEDCVTRISEAACKFERPNPSFIHDGVEVDIAAIATCPEQNGHASKGKVMEAGRAFVSDDRPHLASQLSEVAGKETLVLPIEAGGSQE